MDNDIIGEVDPAWVREFSGHILGTIPEEKIKCELRQVEKARIMKAAGSVSIDGIGQRISVMDRRLYMRLFQSMGHHEGWEMDLLKDNPSLRAPGYRPDRKGDYRHGITFINGKPVGKGPQSQNFK
jgi:hypothetical protein